MQNSKYSRMKFYQVLMKTISKPLIVIIGVTVLYLIMMTVISHKNFPFDYFILIFAFIKTYFIALITFKHLSKLVKNCYSFDRLFLVFGLIILVTLLSFAIDYTCLYESQESSFTGTLNSSYSYIAKIPDFFYFSVTTFATVGYGDIVPVSSIARILVILEISLSFLIIVFALTNITKIHINEK